MPVYEDLQTTVIGEMKRAAIDMFMSDQGWPPHIADDSYYSLWGFIGASSYVRPGEDGSGGGEPSGFSAAGDSMAPSFDSIRGWIDDLTSKWLDLPDGSACTPHEQVARGTAAKFGVAAGGGTVEIGYIGDRNSTIDINVANGIRGAFVAPFHQKYQARFGDVCMGLGAAAAILQINYAAQAAIWPAARTDVTAICVQARDALREKADASASAYGAVTLTVIGAIAGGIASVATAGAAAPLVATMVSIAGAAAVATAGMEAHATITGSTYTELLESLGEALRILDEGITAQEQGLATMMTAAVDTMYSDLSGFNLDAFRMAPEREDGDELFMNRTNTDIISSSMRDIVDGLATAASGFGAPPSASPTPRSSGIGIGPNGTHAQAQSLHELTNRCLELTHAEYERGKGLFDATVEDFFQTDLAAASDVRALAADEALSESLGL